MNLGPVAPACPRCGTDHIGPCEPPWLIVARRYLGTREIAGPKSNIKILDMAKRIGGWVKSFFTDDDIPWCGLFVGDCLVESGYPASAQTLAARSYESYGVALQEPALGAIVVFVRQGGGHVGFYLGETVNAYRILGGNQSNTVSETWIEKNRSVAVRWPAAAPLPLQGRIILASNGERLSTNEA
jgi:uncharacterized protein (TIGR02594 family)